MMERMVALAGVREPALLAPPPGPPSVPEGGGTATAGDRERSRGGWGAAEPRIELRDERRILRRPDRRTVEERKVAWRNDAALWAHDCVWIQKPDGTIGPIELYPEQAAFLREASRREPHPLGLGRPIHKTVVASRPKRNAKSEDIAILIAHSVALFERRSGGIIANSQDQARSVTFDYVADIFDYSPALQGLAHYGTHVLDGSLGEKRPEVTTIHIPILGSEIRAMVPNVRTIQGRGINAGVGIEELQAAYSEEAYALLASQTEASSAQIFIASQAGHRNGALWRLYRAAANLGGDNDRVYFDYWGDEDARAANRAPWITDEFLADAALNMTPWEFAKYHCNLWGSGTQTFLSPDLLEALFAINYPLAAQRHCERRRGSSDATDTGLRTMRREQWQELRRVMGWGACAIGIGLDRAQPYAGREGTNVSATLKTWPGRDALAAGATPGWHYWEIASVDCPNGSEAEIEEAIDAIETVVGRRIRDRAYEAYQSADLADRSGAQLIAPTSGRQRLMFNRVHQLARERRYHCSPHSVGLRAELEEFTVDASRAQPRFEHPAGGTDDRIYSHGYSLEAVVDVPVWEHLTAAAPRGM